MKCDFFFQTHHPHHHHSLGSMHDLDADLSHLHHIDADNVAILSRSSSSFGHNSTRTDGGPLPPMSTIRKCLFIASIVLCIATVVVFLWIVPCSDDRTCPADSERSRTKNWLRKYERIELKGGINVVDGLKDRSKNLVFMYRGDKMWSDGMASESMTAAGGTRKRNGIISLMGGSGQVSWFDEIVNEPSVIDCGLLDANGNGITDCLVLDEFGELGCIDPLSGQWIWHIVARTVRNTELLSFPLVLPDLNRDGVNELLVTTNGEKEFYNSLIIVSGATGKTVGSKYTLQDCSYIHKFQLDSKYKVSFNCIHNDTEKQIVKTLEDLHRLITNKSVTVSGTPSSKKPDPIAQHKFYGQRKDTRNQRNIYSVAGKQLIVENNGKCPDDCNVTVQLIEKKGGKDHVVRNFTGPRMYGMVPAMLSFNASQANGRQSIQGFVIKFWEWGLNETDIQYQTRHRRSTFHHAADSEFNRFGDVLQRKRAWSLPANTAETVRVRRTVRSSSSGVNGSDFSGDGIFRSKMRLIKETVVLIVFNSTDTRIENTSQSNIVQFCRKDDAGGNDVACQPDLNYQENSVLIADLDQDGSQELVTYYTTFANEGDDTKMDWKLVTFVQLLRLEAELPKLYVVEGQK